MGSQCWKEQVVLRSNDRLRHLTPRKIVAAVFNKVWRTALVMQRMPGKMRHKRLGTEFVPQHYGVLMRANWQDVTFNYCFNGHYGTALSDLLKGFSKPFVFLDIGANQGLYSLIAAQNPRCTQVLAFEPVERTHRLLSQNIAANGLGQKVTAVRAAVSSGAGSINIRVPKLHSGGATLQRAVGVNSETLDETITAIGIGELDEMIAGAGEIVVKIDVEGHEAVVLAQIAKSAHIARISTVFYEVDDRWVKPQALQALLTASGFRSFVRQSFGKHYDVLARR